MNPSLYQAASGMQAISRWQEVISENLSSSQIPGFKRQTATFSSIQAGLMGPGSIRVEGVDRHFGLPTLAVSTDFRPGELKPAGDNDLAIGGRGFFEVTMPNGAKAYTRDGEFRKNQKGQLVTKQGYVLEGSNGAIQLDPANPSPLVISSNGIVCQGDAVKGTIKVVDFPNYDRLTAMGSGMFIPANGQVEPATVPDATIHQGFTEEANTSSVLEMASLLTSVRQFEANQKVIQVQDERMGRMITDIANP